MKQRWSGGMRVPLQIIDGEPEYEVEAVLDSRLCQRKLQFLVSWKGYAYEEHSWVNDEKTSMPLNSSWTSTATTLAHLGKFRLFVLVLFPSILLVWSLCLEGRVM
jgi:Chromo (CHRromatin Organisation MOdifier) domain